MFCLLRAQFQRHCRGCQSQAAQDLHSRAQYSVALDRRHAFHTLSWPVAPVVVAMSQKWEHYYSSVLSELLSHCEAAT